MDKNQWRLWIFVVAVAVALVMFGTACATSSKGQEKAETQAEETHTHGEQGEHTHGQEGEETGEKFALTDTYDQTHHGVRLVLAYHNASSSFVGSVENVTDKTIEKVRVDVHLSTGVELGPTEPKNLAPGEKAGIKIEAQGHVFEWWTTHPETGEGEYIH
jgi:hypothetical protein